MTLTTTKSCAELLHSVKSAAGSSRAAMLTDTQYAQVTSLVSACETACVHDDWPEANRLADLIASILREGPPRFS